MQDSIIKKNAPLFWLWSIFLFSILVGLDQWSKLFASSIFKNYVFAFSLKFPLWFIYTIYFAVMFSIFWYCVRNFVKLVLVHKVAWVFIFAGAIANIGERIFLGYVRDWINIYNGVFNLADFYIIFGVLLLLLPKTNKKYDSKNF